MPANTIIAKNAGAANVALATLYDSTANTHTPVHFCSSNTVFVTDSRTRANTNTTYAANTLIGNTTNITFAFANVARANTGTGQVVGARLTKGGVTGGQTVANTFWLRAHLFNADPALGLSDTNAYSMTFANRAKRIGQIDFTSWSIGSDCVESFSSPSVVPTGFQTDSTNKIYAVIQTMGSHVPANTEVYELTLTVIQD